MRRPHPGWALLAVAWLALVGCDSKPPAKPKPTPGQQAAKPAPPRVDPSQWKVKQEEDGPKPPQPGQHQAPGALGVYGPLARDDANEWLGQQYLDGAQLRFQQFRSSPEGQRFSLQLFEADASKGAGELERVLQRNPQPAAVLGHVSDREALAAVPAYQNNKSLMLPLAPGGGQLLRETDQAYRITYDDAYYGRALAALLKKKGWGSVALLAGPGPHAEEVAGRAAEQAVAAGLAVAGKWTVEGIEQAEATARELAAKPADVVLIVARNPRDALGLVRAVGQQAGSKAPLVVSDGGAAQDFLAQLGQPSRETYVASLYDPDAEEAREFDAAFRKRFERAPDLWAALAYDAAGLFCAGLDPREVTVNTFERYLKGLSAAKPYRGVTGPVWFDRRGQAIARPVHLLRWDGKRLSSGGVELTPEERLALFRAKPAAGTTGPAIRPGEVKWFTSIPEALAAAEESGRPILVDFYSKTCVPCERMAVTTWPAAPFKEAARWWVLLRLNLDKERLLVGVYKVDDLPIFGWWTPQGAEVLQTRGYKSAEEIVREMKQHRAAVLELARTLRERVQAIDPEDTAPQVALAELLKSKRAYLRAADWYERAQTAFFGSGQSKQGLALFAEIIQCLNRADDPARALRACDKWIKLDPKSEKVDYAHYMAGVFLERQGKRTEARTRWEKLMEQFPAENYFVKKALIKLRN